jgi:hypothetical protein
MRETTMEDRRWKMEVTGPFDLPSRRGSKEEPRKLPEDGGIFADQYLGELLRRSAEI